MFILMAGELQECLTAFATLTRTLKDLLDKETSSRTETDKFRQTVTQLSNDVVQEFGTDTTGISDNEETVETGVYRGQLSLSPCRISSVNVLTPSGTSYSGNSQGVVGICHRQVCRLSSRSAVKSSRISDVYSSLLYRTTDSTDIEVSPPPEVSPWQQRISSHADLQEASIHPSLEEDTTVNLNSSGVSKQPSLMPPPRSTDSFSLRQVQVVIPKLELCNIKPFRLMQHDRLKDTVPKGVVGGMVSAKGEIDDNDSTERGNDLLEVKMEVDEDLVPTNRNEDLESGPESDMAEITEDQELSTYLFSPSDQLELKEENTVECTNNENESVDIRTWSENESVDIRTRSENESVDIKTRSENESVSVKQEESNSGNEFWPVVKEDTQSDGKHLEPGKVTLVKQEFVSPLKSGQRKMKKRKVDDDSYSQLKYFCTACGKTIYTSVDMVCTNERLKVIVCEACFRTYSKGEFSLDSEGHEMYCSLCGDGGEIVLCDSCEKAMCMGCIGRIVGEDVLESILENEEEEWQCFCCDPAPIEREQELCKLYRFAKSQEEKQGRRKRNTRRKKMAVLSTSEKKNDVKKKGTSSLTVFKSKEFVSSSDESDDGGSQDKSLIPIPHTETEEKQSGYSSASTVCDMDVTEKNHTTDKDTTSTILPLANTEYESSDIKEDLDNTPKRKEDKPVSRDLSPLSLVDQTSDEEIKSDEVSLSDEETPALASGRKQKKVDQTETSTQSDSQTKGTKKNRLSLRLKSRRIGKSEYGLEQKGNPHVSSSSSDESDKGCLVKRKVSHSEKRRVSREGGRKGHDGGRDVGKKRKMGSNDERESPMIELSSDEMEEAGEDKEMEEVGEDKNKVKKDQNGVTLKKKLHNVTGLLFSSDDERNSDLIIDNLLSVLSSSEESEMESISTKEDNKVKESSLNDSKSLQYTLNYVSTSDSEQEIFERKPKRKRIVSLSDDSTKSNHRSTKTFQFLSDDDFEDIKDHSRRQMNLTYRRKKRRLIRSGFNSSGDEESEEEPHNMRTPVKQKVSSNSEDEKDLSTPGKRKNIRKVLPVGKLTNETKEAQKAERERIQRIKKRNKQRKEEDGVEAGQIILEDDPKTKEVKLEIRPELVPKILPHQSKGIKFLYNCCCEDLERLNNEPGSGAILAHCMGLGKTLQVIALLDALMLNSDTTNINTVLVLCPVNTLYNWSVEWNKWLPITLRDYHVWIMNDKANSKRVSKLERWSITGGVMIMGYEMFRNLSQIKNIRRKKHKEVLPKYLLDPGPDIIVCDEGHVLRQEKSNLSVAVNQVRTRRRIVLTGTPLQNNLEEYFTMVSFVKPSLLGTLKEFRNRFVNPISNGQCSDSQPQDVRQMKQRAHVLHQLLNGCVDRRDYRILAESLPPKYEYVVNIRMSPLQEELIKRYLERNSGYHTSTDLFSTFQNLLKVWNHPWVLMLDKERKDEERERQLLDVFIDDEESDDDTSLDGFIVKGSDSEDEFRVKKKEDSDESSNTSRQSSVSKEVVAVNGVSEKPPPSNWYEDLLPEDLANKIELSGKLVFLLELLKEAEKVREKVLVFSQSLLILNMIEEFIQSPQGGEFIEGINYFRLDGSTKADDRLDFMKRFNNKSSVSSHRLRLFLISTRAGSLGVNLIGANRVVIFDACWNPTHDLQSIFRTYRFGQTKPVFVYRLLAKGTMEEKIYDRQITKQSLSMRVIDEKQIGRHYTFSQLQELFLYNPPPPPPDTPPTEPYEQPESDILFCKILEKLRPQHIVGFHIHESLLEHVFDEELSEEERKAAWESYNMQKEMDSRAYNIGIQTQNSFPVAGVGMTPLMQPIMQPVMQPAQNQIQATIGSRVIQLIQTGVEVADTVKNLLSLRNSLATVVRNPAQVSARQRYITTYSVLNRKIQDLYTITPQIREVLSTNTVRSSLSPNEQRHLDALRTKFLQELREVDSKTKVSVPHPAELAEPQFQQPSYIVM